MNAITMEGIYFTNPIKTLHRLKEAGFTEKQAEAQVEILSDYVEHGLTTKKDLHLLRKDLHILRKEVNKDLSDLESRMELKLKDLELRLTIKTASIVGSIVGFFYLLGKFA